MIKWEIRDDALILDEETADTIRIGGIVGAKMVRKIRQDVALAAETIGRPIRVVTSDGRLMPQFASN